jgi:hypothetical protein
MTTPTPEPPDPQAPVHGPEPANEAERRLGRRRRRRRHRRRMREQAALAESRPTNASGPRELAPHTVEAIREEAVREKAIRDEKKVSAILFPAPPGHVASPHELTLDGPPVGPPGTDGRFLRAVLKEDGTILYRMKTRQRLGAKYLMREVFD